MIAKTLGLLNGKSLVFSNSDLNSIFSDHFVYEVMRLINGKALFLDSHLNRLVKSCNALNYPPLNKSNITKEINQLIKQNQLENTNIKIMILQSQRILFPIESHYPSEEDYLRGVQCSLLFEERKNPEVKAHQASLREKSNKQIQSEEIYESVLVNRKNQITEGSRSNLFFIKKGIIYTAEDALVLGGITREKVIDICETFGFQVKYEAVSIEDLVKCQSAFICGTSPGVLPIQTIDHYSFQVDHPLFKKIHQKFHERYLSS